MAILDQEGAPVGKVWSEPKCHDCITGRLSLPAGRHLPDPAHDPLPGPFIRRGQADIGIGPVDDLKANGTNFVLCAAPAGGAAEPPPCGGKAIVPAPAFEMPPQADGLETDGMAAAADRHHRLMEGCRIEQTGWHHRAI